jgi:AcrR family transcriptional regulator
VSDKVRKRDEGDAMSGSGGSGKRRVGRPPGPRRDPGERREELLDAFVRAIREHGSEVSMAQLAAEAGVTRPVLYDAFGDRAGVAAALVARYGADIDKALGAAFAKPITLREALLEGIEYFVRFIEREPDVFRFLEAAAAAPDQLGSMERSIGVRLGEVLSVALRSVGGDPNMGPTWAHALLGMVFSAAEWWSTERPVSRRALVVHLESFMSGALSSAGIAEIEGPFA